MKIRWSVLLTAIALTLSVSSLMAQQGGKTPPSPEERAEKQTANMVKNLGLDATQAAKVKAINLEFAQKMQAAREENQGDRETMKATRMEMQNNKNEALKEVLTKEQFEKHAQMQENRGKKGGKKGGHKGNKAKVKGKKGADDSK